MFNAFVSWYSNKQSNLVMNFWKAHQQSQHDSESFCVPTRAMRRELCTWGWGARGTKGRATTGTRVNKLKMRKKYVPCKIWKKRFGVVLWRAVTFDAVLKFRKIKKLIIKTHVTLIQTDSCVVFRSYGTHPTPFVWRIKYIYVVMKLTDSSANQFSPCPLLSSRGCL